MIARALTHGVNRLAARTIDPIHPRDPALAKLFGTGRRTKAGVDVTEQSALALPGIWRGLNVIANGVRRTPMHVYQHGEEGRVIDKSHFARKVIRNGARVNPMMSLGRFQHTLQLHAGWWGNGLAFIRRDNAARPIELIPLLPDRSGICLVRGGAVMLGDDNLGDRELEEWRLMFYSHIAGRMHKFYPENILHICGPSLNGFWGKNIVSLMREQLGGHLATDEHGQRVFGQGASISGFVSVEGSLDDEEAVERFQNSLNRATQGMSKAHTLVALEEGAKFHPASMSNEDAQFLATKQYNRTEQALIVGIQSSKIGDRHHKSYNSLEMENQEHASDDICPWLFTWYEEASEKLLTEDEKENETHEIDFDDSNLEWVSYKDRILGAEKLFNSGLGDHNESRAKVNLPPSKKNPNAGKYRRPLNIGYEGDPVGNVRRPRGDGDRKPKESTAQACKPKCRDKSCKFCNSRVGRQKRRPCSLAVGLAEDTLAAIIIRLSKQANKHALINGTAFVEWLDGVEAKQGPKRLHRVTVPMVKQFKKQLNKVAETTGDNDGEALADRVLAVTSRLQKRMPKHYAARLTKEPTK